MSNDHELAQTVLSELAWEPRINADLIEVTASAGVITLDGHVSTLIEKDAAAAAVHRLKSVKALVDNLRLSLSADTIRTDDEIKVAALINPLILNSQIYM